MFISFLFIVLYSIIRFTYITVTPYNLLVIGSDVLTSFLIVLLIQYLIHSDREKTLLIENQKREQMNFRNEKLKVVGELAAGMAHEIRNPLTSIKGFLQLSASKDYNIKPWYDLIMYEVTRMSELTGEFLQFSKHQDTSLKSYNLHKCLLNVISLTESEALRLGHQIIYNEYDESIYILIDKDKMIQVIVNLVKNALEAMPESGEVHLRLTKEKNKVSIEVTDSGAGIPKTHLDKIFNPFFTTKASGTGLGLSICQKIIQDHGGTIEVSSTLGKGTSFIVSLPDNTL
jgi:signal transduction histidine kinase